MKKYIVLSLAILIGTSTLVAQDKVNASNKSNVPMILVDGKSIPYSEYKAQQDALKKQQEAKQVIIKTQQEPTLNSADAKLVSAKVQLPNTQPTNETKQVVPNSVNAGNKVIEATAPTVVPSPAIQTIPVGSLKSSVISQPPVITAAAVKQVEANKGSVTPTAVAIPALTLATGDGAQAQTTPVSNKMPEQVNGQPKATEAVVTPPSVINPTPKSKVKE